jgi:hypothetical protein
MTKKTSNMLVITNESGEIVAAQVEDHSADAEATTVILPAKPDHTLYIVRDVPAEIYNIADPAEFQEAVTAHFNSDAAKLTRTSAEELGFTPPARSS